MEKNLKTQLELNFTPARRRTIQSAADRILKNFHQQQRKIYFGTYQSFKRDSFIALNGVQMY